MPGSIYYLCQGSSKGSDITPSCLPREISAMFVTFYKKWNINNNNFHLILPFWRALRSPEWEKKNVAHATATVSLRKAWRTLRVRLLLFSNISLLVKPEIREHLLSPSPSRNHTLFCVRSEKLFSFSALYRRWLGIHWPQILLRRPVHTVYKTNYHWPQDDNKLTFSCNIYI